MTAVTHSKPTKMTFSCDTIAVSNGVSGNIFAKNSDRPGIEPQPLISIPAGSHARGDTVQCQYLRIPQVESTLEVLGSQPSWLWGFEHGVNEAGVAIGNEAVYTLQGVPDTGLLGMDLVRLGLERAATAHEAANVITSLLEEFGQGGAATEGGDRKYHNSFLIVDAESILVLETSDRNWAIRDAPHGAAISNCLTIEDDWASCSSGIEEAAVDSGLGVAPGRFNFRATFEDTSARVWSQARYLASCMVVQRPGNFDVEALMRHLRDHFEGSTVHVLDSAEGNKRPRSICYHPGSENFGATSASMVVELQPGAGKPTAWCSMATPCSSPFIPVTVGANLPAPLTSGVEDDPQSLWWQLREIQRRVDQDPLNVTPPIQALWSGYERMALANVRSNSEWAARNLDRTVQDVLSEVRGLLSRAATSAN